MTESVEIVVIDPYVRHTHQIHNFLRFCETVVKTKTCKKLKLITSFENEIQKYNMDEAFKEMAQSLKEYGVELFVSYVNGLQEKEIRFSSGIIIKIDKGLDFFKQPTGKFSVGFCDFELRPVQQTTFQICHQNNQ